MNVTIRNVDEKDYRALKIGAAEEGTTLGEYIGKVLELAGKSKNKQKNPAKILEMKPVNYGKQFKNSSRMIDKWLYEEGI